MILTPDQKVTLLNIVKTQKRLSSISYSLSQIAEFIVMRDYIPSNEIVQTIDQLESELLDIQSTMNLKEVYADRESRSVLDPGLPG